MPDDRRFVLARNRDADSSLPYLVRLPLDGGIALKARERWPIGRRVYCHELPDGWPADVEVVDEVGVRHCARRGSAIDLVLDRGHNSRSQFVFTTVRGRPVILWQTAKTVRAARPGVRLPTRRAAGLPRVEVIVDTRERYPYRFAGRSVDRVRRALVAGDYAVARDGRVVASVERKTLENLGTSLTDGSLGFQMAELAALPAAAVVVEDRYSSVFRLGHVQPGWIAELIARAQVRYPGVPIVFAESRKLAEEWTYRFLAAAYAELAEPDIGAEQRVGVGGTARAEPVALSASDRKG